MTDNDITTGGGEGKAKHVSEVSYFGEPTHIRINLAGWRDRSVISTSVRIGTDPNALIDVLERVDMQDVWGASQPIVSVDGNARLIPLVRVKARWIFSRILRVTVFLPRTLRDVASVKRHWLSQRAAIAKATGAAS
jgi:hypothetical protein